MWAALATAATAAGIVEPDCEGVDDEVAGEQAVVDVACRCAEIGP